MSESDAETVGEEEEIDMGDVDLEQTAELVQNVLGESMTNMQATRNLSRWDKLKMSIRGWRTMIGMTPGLAAAIDVGTLLLGGLVLLATNHIAFTIVAAILLLAGGVGLLDKGWRRWS